MIFPIPPFSAIGSAYRISESLNSRRMGMENLPAATSYASCSSLKESGWAKISSTRRSHPLAASGSPKTVAMISFLSNVLRMKIATAERQRSFSVPLQR
jgi:hypothetical protein